MGRRLTGNQQKWQKRAKDLGERRTQTAHIRCRSVPPSCTSASLLGLSSSMPSSDLSESVVDTTAELPKDRKLEGRMHAPSVR